MTIQILASYLIVEIALVAVQRLFGLVVDRSSLVRLHVVCRRCLEGPALHGLYCQGLHALCNIHKVSTSCITRGVLPKVLHVTCNARKVPMKKSWAECCSTESLFCSVVGITFSSCYGGRRNMHI